jgi:hypothetical protein
LPLDFWTLLIAIACDKDIAGACDEALANIADSAAVPIVAYLGGELNKPAVLSFAFVCGAINRTYKPQE